MIVEAARIRSLLGLEEALGNAQGGPGPLRLLVEQALQNAHGNLVRIYISTEPEPIEGATSLDMERWPRVNWK